MQTHATNLTYHCSLIVPLQITTQRAIVARLRLPAMKSALLFSAALLTTISLAQSPPEVPTSRQPVGVRLAGHASRGDKIWSFEIVMEGFDLYYSKEWDGQQNPAGLTPSNSGFVEVSLIVGDFDGAMSKSWSQLGSREGGNSGLNGPDIAKIGRRLWSGNTFRGVVPDELREAVEYGHFIEEFSTPVSMNHFITPCVILWTDNSSPMPDKTPLTPLKRLNSITTEIRSFLPMQKNNISLARTQPKLQRPQARSH